MKYIVSIILKTCYISSIVLVIDHLSTPNKCLFGVFSKLCFKLKCSLLHFYLVMVISLKGTFMPNHFVF